MIKPSILIKTVEGEYELLGSIESIECERYESKKITVSDCHINYINEFEATITPINISRKRFIKKLMAKGIQRNGAKEIADYFLKKRGRYYLIDLMHF